MIIKAETFRGSKRYYCGSISGALDQAINESVEMELIIMAVVNKFGEDQDWKYVRTCLDKVKRHSKFNIFTRIDTKTGFMTVKKILKGYPNEPQ
jgi:hypothetical protein|tara:strand:+ start:327 stop:608 length:282 start_codon:yes stop_codon:yes gene_type:complete